MRRPPISAILEALVDEELALPEAAAGARRVLVGSEPAPPWYLRGLVGAGAWLSGLIAAIALGLMDVFRSSEGLLALGIPLIVASVFVARRLRGDFPRQLSLVMSLAGQLLLAVGIATSSDSSEDFLPAIMLVVCVVLLVVHPEPVHRFLVTIGAVVALIGQAVVLDLPLVTELLGVLVVWGTAAVWLGGGPFGDPERSWEQLRGPVAYGMVVGVMTLTSLAILPELSLQWFTFVTPVGVGLGGALVVLVIFRAHGIPPTHPAPILAASALVAVAAVTWLAPGIVAAFTGLVIGFHRRRPVLIGLCAACVVGFVGAWYYNLGLTLLDKSLALMGGGALFLALRFALSRWRPR